MVAAGLVWAAVAWASTTVRVDGVKSKPVNVADLKTDVDENYKVGSEYEHIEGVSLRKVLGEAGVRWADWTRVFIDSIEVRRDEYGSFSRGLVPVFYISEEGQGDEVIFLRPKKGSHPAERERSGNHDLPMNYRAPVTITPSLDNPETGETIEFEADGPGRDDQYDFQWSASSGETGEGPTFSYTFPSSPGRVQITVEGTKSGQIEVEQTIGTPVKAPPPENTGGSGGFGGTGGLNYDYTDPSSDFDYNFPDSASPDSPRLPETPKTPDPDETPPIAEFGTSVEGELLSATAPLPPSSGDALPPEEEPPPDPEAAIEEAEEINAPGALIAAGVVVGLLGLGAGREMETVRPRRLRRPNARGLRRLSPPWK
jgi:hypothetical protein